MLSALGEQILRALAGISEDARRQLLGQRHSGESSSLNGDARRNLGRILNEDRQALQTLQGEPSIARVDVKWLDTNSEEVLYICRASSAGVHPKDLDARVVSYRSALGRLAAIPAGKEADIVLPNDHRRAVVHVQVHLHPSLAMEGWDSTDNDFQLAAWRVAIESIRHLLGYEERVERPAAFLESIFAEDEARQIYLDQRKRKTIEKMQLRDQPVLDQFQDLIFRLPLDKQVFLLGPPGTGKTTTLIRRLAQKKTEEALTPEESEKLNTLGIRADFLSDTGWAMFSPTELLKLYVQEAFNREAIPATRLNLRTWDAQRTSLARDTLRILRGATSGRFTLTDGEKTLMDSRSPTQALLHDEFVEDVDAQIINRCDRAREWMRNSGDSDTQGALVQIEGRFGSGPTTLDMVYDFAKGAELFRSHLGGLEVDIGDRERAIADAILMPDQEGRLNELVSALRKDSATELEDEDEEDDQGEGESLANDTPSIVATGNEEAAAARTLLRAVRWLAVGAAEGRVRAARGNTAIVLQWLDGQVPAEADLIELGRAVQLRRRLRILFLAARSLVFAVPALYARFRRASVAAGKWFRSLDIHQNRLSPAEVDILILVMLRKARRALRQMGDTNWLKPIQDTYLMQVLVDQATDFSCVQLACMLELAHPKLRSWFACGDFRQRITRHGILKPDELHWIASTTGVPEIELHEIAKDYRQTLRLKVLAEALDSGRISSPLPPATVKDEPAPLLAEHLDGNGLSTWLAERILEIERSIGRLPSIGIFVDGEQDIDPLVESVRPNLADRNLRIVGCRDGRDVGNVQEVRVFDVQHVKGLEFEAVFFIGADALATRLPDLYVKYIYVGITRAATFLGITCRETLPRSLDFARPLLSHGTWA